MPTATTATPTAAAGAKGRGLRAHIVALVAATLLPAFAISGWAVREAVSSYKDAFEERLRDTSRALATALDREFEAHVGALTALAASPGLDGLGADGGEIDGLAEFHGHARRAAEALGTPVVLIGTDLRQRLHTERPFGAPLPPTNTPEALRRAVETGRPALSGLRTGAVMRVPVASVVVPVVREGRAVAALSAPVAPARLSRLLAEQGLAGGAFATAMDGGHTIVARSARADEFVGRRAPEWVVRAVEAGSGGGLVEGRTLTGEPVVAVFHRLRLAPEWAIAVGTPRAAYAESAQRPLVALTLGGAATLLLALACAAWLGARILRPVRALERQAEAVAATEGITGPPPDGGPAKVAEFESLRRAMLRADAALRDREARQALLVREVDHRAKNALAVVQSVLRLTPRGEPAAFAAAVEARVAALARVHSLLAEGGWSGADLRALAERELAPYAAQRQGPAVSLDGPDVPLAPAAAQPIAMVLHELATNAAKHGALSVPGGRVEVRWRAGRRAADDGMLRLRWAEAGGPPVPGAAPPRRGFGTRVVEATVRGQLGGMVERRWGPPGLVVEVALPLARVAADGAARSAAAPMVA